MPLAYSVGSIPDLYRKLERESYRAYHADSPMHKADHFFNFCVTAHSMRDYCLEHLGLILDSDKQPFYEVWNAVPLLVAVQEIANSSKHYVLRNSKNKIVKALKTRTVRSRYSTFVDIYENEQKDCKFVLVKRPDVSVTLSDGKVFLLSQFTHEVMEYWRSYLLKHGIKLRRQSLRTLIGSSPRMS